MIGFCFMVTDDINHVGLWESYFSNAGERAKIFVHRAKSLTEFDEPLIIRQCANEEEECLCSGNVYYVRNMGKSVPTARVLKARNRVVKKRVSTSIRCTNEAFGRDPAPFVVKSCYCAFENKKSNLPLLVDPNVSALVRDHMLPIKEHVYTAWGDISLVRAAKALFNRCYSSGAVKCVLLSGSDVPIRPFDEAYSYLTAHNKSHLDYASVPPVSPDDRWTEVMMLQRFVNNIKRSADFAFNIDVRHFTYHSMWMALTREHVKIFVDDTEIFQHFETAFTPDENYVFYLLSYHGMLDEVVQESMTYVNWHEPVKRPGGGQSPKTYTYCSMDDIETFSQYRETLFARKFSADSNIDKLLLSWWEDPQRPQPMAKPTEHPRHHVVPLRSEAQQLETLRKEVASLRAEVQFLRRNQSTDPLLEDRGGTLFGLQPDSALRLRTMQHPFTAGESTALHDFSGIFSGVLVSLCFALAILLILVVRRRRCGRSSARKFQHEVV